MAKYYVEIGANDMGFDAHLTLNWMGEVDKEKAHQVWKFIINNGLDYYKTICRPRDFAMFGENKDIPVVRVDVASDLVRMVEALTDIVPSGSEFAWNPHITLPKLGWETIHIPTIIPLEKVRLQPNPVY